MRTSTVQDAAPDRAAPGPDGRPTIARAGLSALMHPRSVAVIGATERAGSVGAAVMRNLVEGGFRGPISPVNPRHARVFSHATFARVLDIPSRPDLAVVCTPAPTVPGLVRDCGEAGVPGVLVISSGFKETGAAGLGLEERIRGELRRFPGTRLVGPNCLGMLVPAVSLNASFAPIGAAPGGVALLSQSGALCTAILGWARDEGIGFSHFVSVGNMLDVDFADLLEYLADRPEATSVVLYIEAITDGRRFLSAARRCVEKKPVIACKAGRQPAGTRAAASHTGALAGVDAVYQAAFDEVGITRIGRLDDLLATVELMGRRWLARGSRLAIVTNAGGPGVIATDTLAAARGTLAALDARTIELLDRELPAHWSRANPVDVIGDATAERLATALALVLQDENVDAALVIVTPQAIIDTAAAARAVAAVASKRSKPVLACWMGGGLVREATESLQAAGIAAFSLPEQAVDAFMHLAARAESIGTVRGAAAEDLPVPPGASVRSEARSLVMGEGGTLSEASSKAILSMYGIPVVRTLTARDAAQAAEAARTLGYPVALKVISREITHKSDVGGVMLDLRTDADVRSAFEGVRSRIAAACPGAGFEGATIQPMLDRSKGLELIVGARKDATFGPVVLVGAGGVAAEVLRDQAIGLAPLSPESARHLLDRLTIRPLLGGYRGRPPLSIEALVGVIVRLSLLICDLDVVQEVDANPVLVTADSAVALDARVVAAGCEPSGCPRRAGVEPAQR